MMHGPINIRFTKEALDGFVDFRIGERIIRTVQYVIHLVAVNKEGGKLQGISDRLIEM